MSSPYDGIDRGVAPPLDYRPAPLPTPEEWDGIVARMVGYAVIRPAPWRVTFKLPMLGTRSLRAALWKAVSA